MLGFRKRAIAAALTLQTLMGCGGDEESGDGAEQASGPSRDGGATMPASDGGAPAKGDTSPTATFGKKYGDDVMLGKLSTAEQTQYCVDVKKRFASLRDEATHASCTSVALNQTSTPEKCEARREQCLTKDFVPAPDPTCAKGLIECRDPETVPINKLSACLAALAKSFESYDEEKTACDPAGDDDVIPTPPECQVFEIDVRCWGVVEQALSAEGLW